MSKDTSFFEERGHAFYVFILSLGWAQSLALQGIHFFLQSPKLFPNTDWNHLNWNTNGSGSQSLFSVGAGSSTPGNLLEMQILSLHPRPTKSKTLGM